MQTHILTASLFYWVFGAVVYCTKSLPSNQCRRQCVFTNTCVYSQLCVDNNRPYKYRAGKAGKPSGNWELWGYAFFIAGPSWPCCLLAGWMEIVLELTHLHLNCMSSNFIKRIVINVLIFEKHLKRYWLTEQKQQLSVKYFSKYCFIIEIFPYVSEHVYNNDAYRLTH